MPLTRHVKKIGTVDFTEGGVHTLAIPRDGVLTELAIRMKFTITHGAAASTGPLWYALAALIRRIEVSLNGRDTVLSIDGPGAVARAIYEYGTMPYAMAGGAAAANFNAMDVTNATATAYDIVIPIPFFFPNSLDPLAAALPVNRFGQATLELTYGNTSHLFGTVNAGTVISAVTVSVEGDYLLDTNPERPFLARILDQKLDDLPGTTDSHDITIDTGTGLLYRSLLVVTTAAGLAVDTIVADGSLALEAGTFTFQKRDGPLLQAENRRLFDQAAHQTGTYMLTAESFGDPRMLVNTHRDVLTSNLQLIGDLTKVAGTNTLRVYREAVRPFKQ